VICTYVLSWHEEFSSTLLKGHNGFHIWFSEHGRVPFKESQVALGVIHASFAHWKIRVSHGVALASSALSRTLRLRARASWTRSHWEFHHRLRLGNFMYVKFPDPKPHHLVGGRSNINFLTPFVPLVDAPFQYRRR
jgi:hypothetical protein